MKWMGCLYSVNKAVYTVYPVRFIFNWYVLLDSFTNSSCKLHEYN